MAGRQGVAGRTAAALADSARDRAMIARRKAMAAVLGHKRHCPDCGKTARTAEQVTACRDKHQRERSHQKKTGPSRSKTGPARGNPTGSGWGKPGTPRKGPHSCSCGNRGCKGNYRNDLEFNDHARQNAEREDTAKKRAAERDRRTKAVKDRTARAGKPNGAPKKRDGRHTGKLRTPEEKVAWHGQRMQHAAGRMDRDGKRIPHTPSPRTVRPRTPTAPRPH